MLRIQKETIHKFVEHELAVFLKQAIAFLRSVERERWADVSREDLASWTAEHVACARSMGVVEETSILRYLEVASAYGDEFANRGDTLGLVVDPDALDNWSDIRRALDVQANARNEIVLQPG